MALGLLSLVGLPPTSGLWGKLTLVVGAAEAPGWQAWVLVGSVVAASVLSTMALQRVWAEIFWGPPMERYRTDNAQTRLSEPVPLPDDVRIPRRLMAPGATLMAVSVAIFVGIGVLDPVIDRAAAGLLDPTAYVEAVLR